MHLLATNDPGTEMMWITPRMVWIGLGVWMVLGFAYLIAIAAKRGKP